MERSDFTTFRNRSFLSERGFPEIFHKSFLAETDDPQETIKNSSIIEMRSLEGKMARFVSDYTEYCLNSGFPKDQNFVERARAVYKVAATYFWVSDAYVKMFGRLLSPEVMVSPFFQRFFPKGGQSLSDRLLQLYPPTMPLSHYIYFFSLFENRSDLDKEKLIQITMKRFLAYVKYQKLGEKIEIQDNYSLSDLVGLVRPAKIQKILDNFWAGQGQGFSLLAKAKGGEVIIDQPSLKAYEVSQDGKSYLIYATPSLLVDDKMSDSLVGRYKFKGKAQPSMTTLIEVEERFAFYDFLGPVNNNDMLRKAKIKIPVNLHQYEVEMVV